MKWEAFYLALDAARKRCGMTWRDVARETGVTPFTFSRLKKGGGMDIVAYIQCCRWMRLPLDFCAPPAHNGSDQPTGDLNAELILLLSRHEVPEVYWTPLVALVTNLTEQAHRA